MQCSRDQIRDASPNLLSDLSGLQLERDLLLILPDLFPFSRAVSYDNHFYMYLGLGALEYSLFYNLLDENEFHIQNLLLFMQNQTLCDAVYYKRVADIDNLVFQPIFVEKLNYWLTSNLQGIYSSYGRCPSDIIEYMDCFTQAMGVNIYFLTLDIQLKIKIQVIGGNQCLGGIFLFYLENVNYFYILSRK